MTIDPGARACIDREFMLDLYRSAVAFYQPRIERRTGVCLGKIAVWDYHQLLSHRLEEFDREVKRLGRLRAFFLRRQIRRYTAGLLARHAQSGKAVGACYFRNAIYVSFDSETPHEDYVATIVVHELSHALWERIEGVPLNPSSIRWKQLSAEERQRLTKRHLFAEGFATYAERVWFLDLYPEPVRRNIRETFLEIGSVHQQGFRAVRIIVRRDGKDAFLQIPTMWPQL